MNFYLIKGFLFHAWIKANLQNVYSKEIDIFPKPNSNGANRVSALSFTNFGYHILVLVEQDSSVLDICHFKR